MARMGTGTSNLGANLLTTYLEKRFVSKLKAALLTAPLGKQSNLPEMAGNVVRWQFMSLPSAATTTISTEGADPTANAFTTTTAEATVDEYGGYTDYSKHLIKTGLSGTLEEFVDGNAYQAAITIDTLNIGVVDGSSTSSDAGTAMTAESVRTAASLLAANNAQPHPATGGKMFAAIFSVEAAYDMLGEGSPAWFQAKSSDYQAALMTPFDGTPQTGGLYNVLVKTSTNVQRDTTTSPDDDLNVVVANDSFGIAALDTNVMQPRVIITTPEQLVSAPARNRGTAAWWILYAVVLFDNNRVCVIQSDATGVG